MLLLRLGVQQSLDLVAPHRSCKTKGRGRESKGSQSPDAGLLLRALQYESVN